MWGLLKSVLKFMLSIMPFVESIIIATALGNIFHSPITFILVVIVLGSLVFFGASIVLSFSWAILAFIVYMIHFDEGLLAALIMFVLVFLARLAVWKGLRVLKLKK